MGSAQDIERYGDIEVLTRLGSGGMGDVLLGRRTGPHGFEKLVALKTIRRHLAGRADMQAKFLDEARLLARLDHPAIAQLYEFGEQDSMLYLAMEFVPGVTLAELMRHYRRPLPPSVAIAIIAETCRALHSAHELLDLHGQPLNVVHRDISVQNVMLTFHGKVKVLDFGLALMRGRVAPVTRVGQIKGKASYLAPEQLNSGARVDRRTDVYATSVLLHELLCGRKLFDSRQNVDQLAIIGRPAVPPPSSIVAEVPSGTDAVVLRGLEADPARRYCDAREMAEALDSVLTRAHSRVSVERFADRELSSEKEARHRMLREVIGRKGADRVVGASRTTIKTHPAEPVPPSRDARSKRRRLIGLIALEIAGVTAVGAYLVRWRSRSQPVRSPSAARAVMPAPRTSEPSSKPPAEAVATGTTAPTFGPEPEVVAPMPPIPAAERVVTKPRRRGRSRRKRTSASVRQAGVARITIGARPFANVRIDGAVVGPSPLVGRKVSAGRHVVELLSPETGAVRHVWTMVLKPGEHRRFTHP